MQRGKQRRPFEYRLRVTALINFEPWLVCVPFISVVVFFVVSFTFNCFFFRKKIKKALFAF